MSIQVWKVAETFLCLVDIRAQVQLYVFLCVFFSHDDTALKSVGMYALLFWLASSFSHNYVTHLQNQTKANKSMILKRFLRIEYSCSWPKKRVQ